MKVDKIGADYHVYITEDNGMFLTEPVQTLGGFRYRPIDAHIANSDEELQILCTNQSHIIYDGKKARNKIYFATDDKGPLLRIHPSHILSLLGGQNFVMIRYNGSDKLWIYKEDTHPYLLR